MAAEAARATAGSEAGATDADKVSAGTETGPETEETAPTADDGVGIPRQQSAAEAAENEAEEGART
ncbi:gliding motility protein [Streptomyces sp. NPDC001222]|uniref:gliding motility protein n=1 Tax=Streptomyces sp. NPDC001222 TaxID=3364548 RepID=UPI003694C736